MVKVNFTFNDKQLAAQDGQNILQAVTDAGFEIPHYCYHQELSVAGSCRLCAVEIGYPNSSGDLKMVRPLVMACQTLVKENMVVLSETDRVRKHRREIMELLLVNHPLDCPVCDQAGECYLQDYSYRYGQAEGGFEEEKIKQPKKRLGDNVLLYADRCIMCSRCVRFTREVSGGAELCVLNRGNRTEIDVLPGKGLVDKMAGNIVDICPVGAMLDAQFLFKKRVWQLESTKSICPRCSRGCSIYIDHDEGVIWRVRPRKNMAVNQTWMCDDGRYGFKFVHADERLTSCKVRGHDVPSGEAVGAAVDMLKDCLLEENAGKLAAVISPAASCQEQWLLGRFLRDCSDQIALAAGPVFAEGSDERFKGGFSISAEKVPNRRGAELILENLSGSRMTFAGLTEKIANGEIEAVIVQGGFPWCNWPTEAIAASLRKAKVLIVFDMLPSKLSDSADIVFATSAWSEKEGHFISDSGLCQRFEKAIDPPAGAQNEINILAGLAGWSESGQIEQILRQMDDVPGINGGQLL